MRARPALSSRVLRLSSRVQLETGLEVDNPTDSSGRQGGKVSAHPGFFCDFLTANCPGLHSVPGPF